MSGLAKNASRFARFRFSPRNRFASIMPRAFAVAALLLGQVSLAEAAARFVSLTGNDLNAGTIDAPWRRVKASIDRLVAGDTLYLRGGRYLDWMSVSVSGAPGSPIVVRSYPGETAIIDPTRPEFRIPGNSAWLPFRPEIGYYVARNPIYDSDSHVMVWVADIPGYENGRLALPRYSDGNCFVATTDQYDSTAFYVGPGYMSWDDHVRIRLSKTADMGNAEQRYGTVLTEENANPADYSIVVSDALQTLAISGSYLVFKDLVLEPAFRTVALNQNAHDLHFEGMTIWVGNRGISVYGSGVHHVSVTGCRIYGDCPPWIFRSDQSSAVPPAVVTGFESTNIDLGYGTHDWEISYNHIRGSARHLIELTPLNSLYYATPDSSVNNLVIHHNRLENAAEDAIKLSAANDLGRVEVYENFISNCLHALSAGQNTPTFTGPLLFYRNVVSFLRDPAVNRTPGLLTWNKGGRYGYEYMFKLSGSGFTTRNTHIYHNTLVLLNSAGKGMNITPQFPADTRCADNLLVLVNGRVNGSYLRGAGQVVDGNLYWKMNTVDTERLTDSYDTASSLFIATGLEQHGIGATPKRGTDPQLPGLGLEIVDPAQMRWSLTASSERRQPWNFALGASSPARGAGIAIPPHPVLGALPDTRTSIDVGALPFGAQASDFSYFPFDPAPNQAPIVDAGGPQYVVAPDQAMLAGHVTDDGHPNPGALVSRWNVVSGPGPVAFADSREPSTRATFTVRGVYTLALTTSDGEKTASETTLVVFEVPFLISDTRVGSSSDDAEESPSVGAINLASQDLDMMLDDQGSGPEGAVGIRFAGVDVPRSATIRRAYVQFTVDVFGSQATSLTIRGDAADNAATFPTTNFAISSRARTAASVSWIPPTWCCVGAPQQTPDLSAIVQEMVNRTGWTTGNALAFVITGSGGRTAASFDKGANLAPLLHVEYLPPSGLAGVSGSPEARLEARLSPNPMIGSGILRFTMPREGPVRVELFDVRGRIVKTLMDGPASAGVHEIRVSGLLDPGMYFYRVRAAGEVVAERCLFLR